MFAFVLSDSLPGDALSFRAPPPPPPERLAEHLPFRDKARLCWSREWRARAQQTFTLLIKAASADRSTGIVLSTDIHFCDMWRKWLCVADDLAVLLDGLLCEAVCSNNV